VVVYDFGANVMHLNSSSFMLFDEKPQNCKQIKLSSNCLKYSPDYVETVNYFMQNYINKQSRWIVIYKCLHGWFKIKFDLFQKI
jgi:lysyl-tRNA synthetase class I